MGQAVLVVGAKGQLGRALAAARWPDGLEPQFFDRAGLDITDPLAVNALCRSLQPAAIVNAAAFSHVDKAEFDRPGAWGANRLGPLVLAGAASACGAWLLHVSTDYVFDGQQPDPYPPDAPLAPLGTYGRSKAAGEEAVALACPRHLIFRTAWVFSRHAANFARLVFDRARAGQPLKIVEDQWGSPTAAEDLAAALIRQCGRIAAGEAVTAGTYHFAGAPAVSRWELAMAVLTAAERHGIARPPVTPVPASAFAAPAPRPTWSMLAMEGTTAALGLDQPDWRPALEATIAVWAAEQETTR